MAALSPALSAEIDRVVSRLPAHKRGIVTFSGSRAGADVGVGYRHQGVSVGVYGATTWGGKWTLGTRGEIVW